VTPRFLFVVPVEVVGVFRFLFESVVMGTQFVVEPPPVPPEVVSCVLLPIPVDGGAYTTPP
jgi:hypothetical protein